MSLTEFASAATSKFDKIIVDRPILNLNLLLNTTSLKFNIQLQTQSNWCWAATSVSVNRFYKPATDWTQCKVASAEQNINSCCNTPLPGGCNVYWYLDKSLVRVSCYNRMEGAAATTWEMIKAEIQAGRPVGVRTAWSGGGAHFLVIYGVQSLGLTKYFMVDDPIYGKSVYTVANFKTAYRGSGSWTHTYYTKKPPMPFNIKDYVIKPEYLQLIREVEPLFKLDEEAMPATRGIKKLDANEITASHPVHTLGLDDLLGKKKAKVNNPTSLRMVELNTDKNISAAYDISMPDKELEMKNVNFQPEYLAELKKGLDRTIEAAKNGDGEAKLRMINVPALYTEAYWLHYEDDSKDIVIPIQSFGLFKNNEPVPYEVFMSALRERASKVPETGKDDQLGG